MSTRRAMRNETVSERAVGYGIPGDLVDGNDVMAVHNAVTKAALRARAGQGPTLVEARTYRYKGHAKSDQNLYRTRDEIRQWQQRDPIQNLVTLLVSEEKLTHEEALSAKMKLMSAS